MIKRLQKILQWFFMRLEALFNRAFGDKLNPLYHLGAISFFLFWIVAGSGLYLYAFFKTGVADAYDSVEYLTHNQWFLGGILRSFHRYASDGMVLTMMIHMVRHFAYDRMRGFRWFSWVTGVALIWLVYVSGINGYMLPWDKMAQFVVVAAFEWLDWLPMFNGALIRNFIYQTSVNDRFFSLLVFIHLGVSLLVLLVMWIHVQRIPKATTNPPRPIIVALIITFFILSIVKPAMSQGGAADFGTTVTVLDFDWFYLAVFPLFYLWPLGRVWVLVCGLSALFYALPWIPPKWRRSATHTHRMTVHPGNSCVPVRMGETLLEAGLRAGIEMPYECRNGGCGVCKCAVLNGRVEHGSYQSSALSQEEIAQGKTLLCCAVPVSDVEVEYSAGKLNFAKNSKSYASTVESIEKLSDDVIRLMISLDHGETINFSAGQYINIVLSDGRRRAFSFASAPSASDRIELHVRLVPGGIFTTHVFTQMKVGDKLDFEGPLGSFTLQESDRPIIFVAGATGFAPIKSIVEDALQRGVTRPMLLYWGVRKVRDLYMAELAQRWQNENAHFKFIPVISEPSVADRWEGRTGFVHQAILDDFPDLTGNEVYVCGSVKMVEVAFPAFLAHGLSEEFCFSDAFLPSSGIAASPPVA